METLEIVNDRTTLKREFINTLESKLSKAFLFDWAMGWMLDIAIDTAIARKTPENDMFRTIFVLWREKSMELSTLVLTHDKESHLYGGLDLAKMSPEICQRWRNRFAQLSIELEIR